jgi:protein-S-isoprenylcysteine O-methyltransferase Ste14
MSQPTSPQPQTHQQDADWLIRVGGRLFARRTSLPLPIVLALLLIPSQRPSGSVGWLGLALVAAGEFLRLWAVRHIGVISRTRSERLGPLVSTGPFALVRNPLYLGNIALWAGFSVAANLLWLAPLVVVLLAFVYHAVVRWEEGLLESRIGDGYREYVARVPRWVPSGRALPPSVRRETPFSWRDTFFSERGTLIAIAAGVALLYLKFLVY